MNQFDYRQPLTPEQTYHAADVNRFPFASTADLQQETDFVGHARALEAMQLGIAIPKEGFNLFLTGPAGTGKFTIVRRLLEERARTENVPGQWCYVNNFASPDTPSALRMPKDRGVALREDMATLVEDLRSAVPAAFESENYRARKHVIEQELKERQDNAFAELAEEGRQKGVALMRTPTGIIMAPMRNGQVMEAQEFDQLPEEEHRRIEATTGELEKKLQSVLLQFPKWAHEVREKIRELNGEVASFAVGHLIEALNQKYADLPHVVSFLGDVRKDVIDNVDEFLTPPEHPLAALMGGRAPWLSGEPVFFRRYQVNVLVEENGQSGAPVIYEDHPTYQNLIGHVEHISQMGALSTDFTLIRGGALHRANGGYLILDALKLLSQPYAWDALKRSLRSSQIRIESLGEMLGLISTITLRPEPVPLAAKIILVGERMLYYLLSSLDPEFMDLFKIVADFDDEMDRNPETEQRYAQWIGTLARKENLLPFDPSAVARVIEHRSREAGDSEKLQGLRRSLRDLLQEADHWARQSGHALVAAADVQRAIDAQIRRKDRVRERYLEETLRGTVLIDTEGERIGQINGLSVVMLAGLSFGHPSRITARIRLGKGEVIDIEREVELGGPIHSKGVLILSGFLGGRYAVDQPLSLQASLVFEQSYGGVEGDSASAAELFALLSALSGLPLKQSFAVTGSVNQHGQIQPIGGVNEKIEGFFDLCKARGHLRDQAVIIPQSNVRHLMLRRDVVDAIREGRFRIFAISTIDEGMELLTGVPAGERDDSGVFPEGTVNRRVEDRLIELAEKRKAASQIDRESSK